MFDYGSNINVSDEYGLRPRDMIQFEPIKNLMQKYYKNVDIKVCEVRDRDKLTEQAVNDEIQEPEGQDYGL
tara:strand:+ start:134 stop:346 length:213 start_codon:yes stop_codon:yes gene_type:complete